MLSREKQLHRFLSFPILYLLILLGFIPIMWPIFSQYEGEYFPVIKNVQISDTKEIETGLVISLSFDKVRSCEFVGLSWFNQIGNRIIIQFESTSASLPYSRPVYNNQKAGPWELTGLKSLENTIAIVSHRCHPLWITHTKFYP